MRRRILSLLFGALVFPATMLGASKGNATAGKQVFTAHCQMCHGDHGQGNQALGKMLGATIPALSSKQVQDLTDAQIRQVIENGKLKMPPVKGISSSDIDNVIAFVRTLAKK